MHGVHQERYHLIDPKGDTSGDEQPEKPMAGISLDMSSGERDTAAAEADDHASGDTHDKQYFDDPLDSVYDPLAHRVLCDIDGHSLLPPYRPLVCVAPGSLVALG
jgi:hypothetical protein